MWSIFLGMRNHEKKHKLDQDKLFYQMNPGAGFPSKRIDHEHWSFSTGIHKNFSKKGGVGAYV